MKKIFILAAMLLMAASSGYAASSLSITAATGGFADTGKVLHGDDTTASADTALIAKLSTGVALGMKTEELGYALVTQHQSGTKAYGTSYDSTSIFASDEVKVGVIPLAVPTATDTTDFTGTDWNKL